MGLLPSWSKETKLGRRLINARAKAVTENQASAARRPSAAAWCQADGYYEWQATGNGNSRTSCTGLIEGMTNLLETTGC